MIETPDIDERDDDDGHWQRVDGVWFLTEPSEEYAARMAAAHVEPEKEPAIVAAEAIQAEITDRLAPSTVNSIAEVKAAIRDGLAAAVASLGGGA